MANDNKQSIAEIVGDALREYFNSAGISQQEIADRLNITQASVSARFCGLRGFGKNAAKKWSDEFGFDKAFLVNGVGTLFPDGHERRDDARTIQTISGNSGIAINQNGNVKNTSTNDGKSATSDEGFFAQLCRELMQQIIERDNVICCLKDEINNLKTQNNGQ